MRPRLEITPEPTDADRDALGKILKTYNESKVGETAFAAFVVLLRDADGSVSGGLWGRSYYDWLFVEWLAVAEAYRGKGLGTEMIRAAEAEAASRGCLGVWLDTFEFQARGFYEKLGYEVFGTLEDHPRGSRRYFLMKRFER